MTGFNEVYRSIVVSQNNRALGQSNITDNWKTFSRIEANDTIAFIPNFVSKYDKNNFFFKYIVK